MTALDMFCERQREFGLLFAAVKLAGVFHVIYMFMSLPRCKVERLEHGDCLLKQCFWMFLGFELIKKFPEPHHLLLTAQAPWVPLQDSPWRFPRPLRISIPFLHILHRARIYEPI